MVRVGLQLGCSFPGQSVRFRSSALGTGQDPRENRQPNARKKGRSLKDRRRRQGTKYVAMSRGWRGEGLAEGQVGWGGGARE